MTPKQFQSTAEKSLALNLEQSQVLLDVIIGYLSGPTCEAGGETGNLRSFIAAQIDTLTAETKQGKRSTKTDFPGVLVHEINPGTTNKS